MIATVCKADPVAGFKVPDGTIVIRRRLTEEAPKKAFERDARAIHDVLCATLPQGTKHCLLLLMLQDAPSIYRGV